MKRRVLGAVMLLALKHPDSLLAQQPQTGPSGLSVGVETTRDRFHYRFENPSSFGTAELVPHEFTQTYWGDKEWLVARVWFSAGTRPLESTVGATPQKTTRGDDYDTFFQPSGDVVVAGTTGNVSMRSWRARQTIGVGRAAGLDWNIGYQYRRDRSEFGPGLKTITHTRPASLESSTIHTRETTISEDYGLRLGVKRRWSSGAWRMTVGVETSPGTRAKLTTLLPDKYPGRTIVFSALVAAVEPELTVSYGNRWPILFSAAYTRAFSYKHSNQFVRDAATVGIGVGFSAR